jgi:ADP-ribosylglycohydrolase
VDGRARARGCLLGGAVGDALGAPVEFSTLRDIRDEFGPSGVHLFAEREPAITDDTQMTLFTAEGVIRASVRGRSKGICHPPSVVHHAYLRWLHTQETRTRVDDALGVVDGWLVADRRLHRRRAPGNTCLAALRSGVMGTTEQPLNDSKGCGGVMRVAPVGVFVADVEEAFRLGCEVAAITHGHPTGWLASGAFAAIIASIMSGADLADAVARARVLLDREPNAGETIAALDAAVDLARRGMPSAEDLEQLGGGWVAEEALAIAVCCALAAPDFRTAVSAAVTHSGDSDSTGSICGNIRGALEGEAAVPREWIDAIDVADVVTAIADDLWTERTDPPSDEWGGAHADWFARYPGW